MVVFGVVRCVLGLFQCCVAVMVSRDIEGRTGVSGHRVVLLVNIKSFTTICFLDKTNFFLVAFDLNLPLVFGANQPILFKPFPNKV